MPPTDFSREHNRLQVKRLDDCLMAGCGSEIDRFWDATLRNRTVRVPGSPRSASKLLLDLAWMFGGTCGVLPGKSPA